MEKEIKDLEVNKEVAQEEVQVPVVKLTAGELKKQEKKLEEQKEFSVKIGDTMYTLTHDVIFRKTKQQELLGDMLDFFNSIESDNIALLDLASPYTALLVIKHFTSLDVPNEIEDAIALLRILLDLDNALARIIAELPEDQVLEIYDVLAKTVENIQTNIEEAEAELEKVADEIDNKEVLKLVEKEEVIEDGEKSEE